MQNQSWKSTRGPVRGESGKQGQTHVCCCLGTRINVEERKERQWKNWQNKIFCEVRKCTDWFYRDKNIIINDISVPLRST